METPDNATNISNWSEVIDESIHLLDMEIFDNHLVLNHRKNGLRGMRVINQTSKKDNIFGLWREYLYIFFNK